MEISDELLCVFSATIENRRGSYVIDVPDRETAIGEVEGDEVYRVALLPAAADSETGREAKRARDGAGPPVEQGEQRTVEIEDIGEQGDGIARVERGYVIIVPDTELRERVTITITDVKENVAFGEVIERKQHYE